MAPVLDWLSQNWAILSIPLVSAIVGYCTNWLAVRMMMYPIDFKGIGFFGWQGVVPRSSKKMSRKLVDQSIGKVISQQEIIDRIDVNDLANTMHYRVESLLQKVVDEVMEKTQLWGKYSVSNFVWNSAPAKLKTTIYRKLEKRLPEILDGITEDFHRDFRLLGNVNEAVIKRLENNKDLLVNIFTTAAAREMRFLSNSGFYFGLPLGIPVMIVWICFPQWWVLPLFGLLVGYLTNEVALYLVQKPLRPRRFAGATIQGLFVKRQTEISYYLGEVFAQKLLNAETLSQDLLGEPSSVDKIHDMIYEAVSDSYLKFSNVVRPFVVATVGPDEYKKSKEIVTRVVMEELRKPDPRYYDYIDRSLDIADTLGSRLAQLPPEDFYALLHPIVAEDKWKLTSVGALLGGAAGYLQWLLLS